MKIVLPLLIPLLLIGKSSYGQNEMFIEILEELKGNSRSDVQIDRNCADVYSLNGIEDKDQFNLVHPRLEYLHCFFYSETKSFKAYLVLSESDLKDLSNLSQDEIALIPQNGLLLQDIRSEERWFYITQYFEPVISCSQNGTLEINELDYTIHLSNIYLIDALFTPISELRIEFDRDNFEKLCSYFNSCDKWFQMNRLIDKSLSYKEISYQYLVELLEDGSIVEKHGSPTPF
jgi:hypothetical protein